MREIRPSASLLVYFVQLVHLEAALLAHPDTRDLAAQVTALLARWAGLFQVELDTRRSTAQVNARVAIADLTLDGVLRSLYNGALGAFGQDRKSQGFRGLFTDTIAVLVRPGLQRQVEICRGVLERLNTLAVVPAGLRDGFASRLAETIATGQQELDARTAQAVSQVSQRFAVESYKTEVNATRVAIYGELVGIGARAGANGKVFADAFFPAPTEGRDDDAEAPEPSPSPA